MSKRLIDLRSERPLLDIASFGRAHRPLSQGERMQIALTVRRAPEVMVKVSGGARTLRGVAKHMSYVGREGRLGMEADTGEQLGGPHFERGLIDDWNLDVEAHELQTQRSILGRKPVKLVHNIVFSMPPSTPATKVLQAVRKLAVNEWQLKHRYSMTLHTDDHHPHVHVVLKAMGEGGRRLNIRKATLRYWRSQFASNLLELGVAANATERAVRGQPRSPKLDGLFRAERRGHSYDLQARRSEAAEPIALGPLVRDLGAATLRRTRADVLFGWQRTAARLKAQGDKDLADRIGEFTAEMSPALTDRELLVYKPRDFRSPQTVHMPPEHWRYPES
jgi:hypothetical protein